jgi:endonuclease I
MFNGTTNQVFNCFLNMLLAWNTQDPVNAREIARNNAIYATQNNRNPYIDPSGICSTSLEPVS